VRIAFVLGLCAAMSGVCRVSASARADPEPAPAPTRDAATVPPAPAPASTAAAVPPAADATSAAPAGPPVPDERRSIVGFAIRGASKVTPRTLGYLSRSEIGDLVGPDDLPRLQQALVSSELFKSVSVALEPAPGDPSPGVIVVVTAVDKHSWIAAPTLFLLPGNQAFGVGFAENNFRGVNQKFLLYAQLGTRTSLFLGSFLDPGYRGTQLTWRTDLYAYRRVIAEYANPPDDPRSTEIARETTATYLGAGALIGWKFRWWLVGDLRLRGAYVYFRDAVDGAGQPVAIPEEDGWDVSLQAHLTIDHRHHRYGVTWGPYLQLTIDPSVPGLDSYGYQLVNLRSYYSWRLFGEHQLELRGHLNAGRHLPLHEDLTLGGVSDLRGYPLERFRGDRRAVARAEYSVPVFKWRFLAFRALGFFDSGYVGFHDRRAERDHLPNQLTTDYWRSDAGGGVRVYLDNIVLPLLGFDIGYGFEARALEFYFELGLTDF
jgi:outer membrane protein insertion porin family